MHQRTSWLSHERGITCTLYLIIYISYKTNKLVIRKQYRKFDVMSIMVQTFPIHALSPQNNLVHPSVCSVSMYYFLVMNLFNLFICYPKWCTDHLEHQVNGRFGSFDLMTDFKISKSICSYLKNIITKILSLYFFLKSSFFLSDLTIYLSVYWQFVLFFTVTLDKFICYLSACSGQASSQHGGFIDNDFTHSHKI